MESARLELDLARARLHHLTGGATPENLALGAPGIMEAVRTQVEERRAKIRDIVLNIARLHTVHNSILPVNRLPPELLTAVFSYVVSASEENADIVNISHVCSHWRNVALDSACLWTRIAQDDPVGITTFLARSKSLPIRLSVTLSHQPVRQVLGLIREEQHRLRGLKVRAPAPLDWQFVSRRLQLVAPILEDLEFEKILLEGRLDRRVPVFAPSTVTEGVPALRTLTLHQVPLPYIPKGPNALRKLDLHGKLLPTMPNLLSLLESSPLLESLSLHGSFNANEQQPDRIVTLPHLTALTVSTFPPQGIAALLSALALPAHTAVALHAGLDIGDHFEDIFPLLPPGQGSLAALAPPRRLELLWDDYDLRLRAFRGADDFHAPALDVSCSHIRPQLGARFLGDWPFAAARVETLVLCESHTEEEFARHGPREAPAPRERWLAVFGALPALRTLRLIGLGEKTLELVVGALHRTPPQPPYCPQLETLELVDLKVSAGFWADVLAFGLRRERKGVLKTVDLFNVGQDHSSRSMAHALQASGVLVLVDGEELPNAVISPVPAETRRGVSMP